MITITQQFHLEGYGAILRTSPEESLSYAELWKKDIGASVLALVGLPAFTRPRQQIEPAQMFRKIYELFDQSSPGLVEEAHIGISTEPEGYGYIVDYKINVDHPDVIFLSVSKKTKGETPDDDVSEVLIEDLKILTREEFMEALAPYSQSSDVAIRGEWDHGGVSSLSEPQSFQRKKELPKGGYIFPPGSPLDVNKLQAAHRATIDRLRKNSVAGKMGGVAQPIEIDENDHSTLWMETKEYIGLLSEDTIPNGSTTSLLRELVMQYTQPCPPTIENIERLWELLPTAGFTIGIRSMLRERNWSAAIKAIATMNDQAGRA